MTAGAERRHLSEEEIVELSVLAAAVGGFASINVARNIEERQWFDLAEPVA